MGRACSEHGENETCVQNSGYKAHSDNSEDLGVGGRIILKLVLGKSGLGLWIGFI
jgi:hypothetical protein